MFYMILFRQSLIIYSSIIFLYMLEKKNFLSELLAYANNNNEWKAILTVAERVHDWKVIKCVCMKKPRLCLESFQILMRCYVYIKSMRNSPDAVEAIEDLIFAYKLVPLNVITPAEITAWNKSLQDFLIAFGEFDKEQTEEIGDFIQNWWTNLLKHHPSIANQYKHG